MLKIKRYLSDSDYEIFKNKGLLKIGNIYHFRRIKDPFRDPKEGLKFLHTENGEILDLNSGEINEASNGKIKMESGYSFYSEGRVEIDYDFPNALVLCCAAGEHDYLVEHFKREKYFSIIKPNEFADYIVSELYKQGLTVIVFSPDWIQYVDSKDWKIQKKDLEKSENLFLINHTNKPIVLNHTTFPFRKYFWNYFTKEKEFELEKEFRFVFLCEEQIDIDQKITIQFSQDTLNSLVVFE